MNIDFSNINGVEDFLNALVNNQVVENKEESKINKEVDEPHIRFKREDLIKMLQLSSSIINPKSNQYVPKSITIVFDELVYKMVANNDLEYLEYEFKVLNEENRLLDTLCLPIELIKSVSNMLDEEIIIYKKDNSYYIRLLLEGDLYLELPSPEPALLRKPTNGIKPLNFKKEAGSDCNLVSCSYLQEALKSLIPIVEEEPILDKRRITFISDRAYYASRKYFMEYNLPLPRIRISLRFADVLRKISFAYNNSGVLEFYQDELVPSRIIVKCLGVLFTSTVTSVPDESRLVEYLDRVKTHKELLVDIKDLERVVNIAYSLPYSRKEIKLKYNNGLILSIPMKTKTTEFKIPSKLVGEIKTNNEIILSARDLKKLLDSFGTGDIIISILDKCVIVNKKNLIGVLEV